MNFEHPDRFRITLELWRFKTEPQFVRICFQEDEHAEQHLDLHGHVGPVTSLMINKALFKLVRFLVDNSVYGDATSKERRYGRRDLVRAQREADQLEIKFGPLERISDYGT